MENKNDAKGLKQSLRAIVPHAFGKQYCSVTWCGFLKDPSRYHHASLLHGGRRADESHWYVHTLAPLVNNTIGNRAPKIWHYGASESNNFRLACAVSQNNLAHNDVSEVSTAVCCFRKLYKCPKSLNRAFENPTFCKINRIKKKGLWVLLKRRSTGYIITPINVSNCEWFDIFKALEHL